MFVRRIIPRAAIASSIAVAITLASPVASQDAAPTAIDETLVPYSSIENSVQLPDRRTIHWVCMGHGSPTVILTAGAGGWGTTWNLVQPAVAKTTRVCAWDRAGFGLSTPPADPQTAQDSAQDLSAALAAAHIAAPYVLVGHSGGSFESLLLADNDRDRVSGMVLVDPSFPDEDERLNRASPGQRAYVKGMLDRAEPFFRQCLADARSGKLKNDGPDPNGCLHQKWPSSYPPELIAALERVIDEATPQEIVSGVETMVSGSSLDMLAENSKLAINPARNYGDMPLIVLTRTVFGAPPDYPAGARAEIPAEEAEWNKGHDELAALSTRGINARVPGSGHDIQHMKPQVVIDAIEQVISEARATR
jgi:pimeloyl-ACP methyl ester carboxylesterase